MPFLRSVLLAVALVCHTIYAVADDGSPRAHRLHVSSSSSQQSAEIRRAPQTPTSSHNAMQLPEIPHHPMLTMSPMSVPSMQQLFPHMLVPSLPSVIAPQPQEAKKSAAPKKPAIVDDGLPKAKALKTEVRKAPRKQLSPLAPMQMPLPQHMHPMQLPQMGSIPTLPTPATVSLPTMETVTFPTISMPTFPTFTMPPPFSSLIPTKKPKKSSKRRKAAHKKKSKKQKPISEELETPDLSSVKSRMPKYVRQEKSAASDSDSPSWMVPYNKL
ncbi:hypothetical protein L596_002803 [Steinernema carpocapsae]|uniref:Uncharacterized protein n=1 Tax=Steinernema carpocapsae TaxID=34508 RepID=A0A4U8US65_STECR|nr:hypothetical protein L596_002803 [Steinernema carpocapsae]